jgi:hypothetical protein
VNKFGIHALVWTEGWSEEECRRAVGMTKQTGYDLIEIPLLDPGEVDAAMTRWGWRSTPTFRAPILRSPPAARSCSRQRSR